MISRRHLGKAMFGATFAATQTTSVARAFGAPSPKSKTGIRLATYSVGGRERIGLVTGDGLIDLPAHLPKLPREMVGLMSVWSQVRPSVEKLASTAKADHRLSDVHLLAPVPRPRKIMAMGLNYRDHIEESGLPVPKQQTWFSKAVTAINGPFDPIELPRVSEQLDYEAELVVIIGKRCRHVLKERAREVIFGYCAGNDVSVRDWQFHSTQWTIGKSFDTHAPIGPWIVTADEVFDPHSLAIRSLVNGEVRQNSNTRHLIFNVYDLVAHLSQAMTLEPGDVIFTGTPGGVGAARKPPVWLKAGDIVRVEIDGIGAIESKVKPE